MHIYVKKKQCTMPGGHHQKKKNIVLSCWTYLKVLCDQQKHTPRNNVQNNKKKREKQNNELDKFMGKKVHSIESLSWITRNLYRAVRLRKRINSWMNNKSQIHTRTIQPYMASPSNAISNTASNERDSVRKQSD